MGYVGLPDQEMVAFVSCVMVVMGLSLLLVPIWEKERDSHFLIGPKWVTIVRRVSQWINWVVVVCGINCFTLLKGLFINQSENIFQVKTIFTVKPNTQNWRKYIPKNIFSKDSNGAGRGRRMRSSTSLHFLFIYKTCFVNINILEISIKFIILIKLFISKNWITLKWLTRQYRNKIKSLNIHAFIYLVIQIKFLTLIERGVAVLKNLNSSLPYHLCGARKTCTRQSGVRWRKIVILNFQLKQTQSLMMLVFCSSTTVPNFIAPWFIPSLLSHSYSLTTISCTFSIIEPRYKPSLYQFIENFSKFLAQKRKKTHLVRCSQEVFLPFPVFLPLWLRINNWERKCR